MCSSNCRHCYQWPGTLSERAHQFVGKVAQCYTLLGLTVTHAFTSVITRCLHSGLGDLLQENGDYLMSSMGNGFEKKNSSSPQNLAVVLCLKKYVISIKLYTGAEKASRKMLLISN